MLVVPFFRWWSERACHAKKADQQNQFFPRTILSFACTAIKKESVSRLFKWGTVQTYQLLRKRLG